MTPYQRIASELRRRINSGALPAGSRLPSTRALARRWKVANATAAHALSSLVQEGLVEARPRSGTVVAGPVEAGGTGGELSRERVIAAALEIADAEGLAALSIRGLAAKLKTPAMSLYRHVHGKEQLIALMTDATLGEEKIPAEPGKGWRAQLELCCRLEWKVMKRHPWLARVIHVTRPSAMPNALTFANAVFRALDGTALSAAGKLQLHILLHSFVQGLAVNLEAEAQALGETGLSEDEHMRAQEAKFTALVATGRYPYFAKLTKGMAQGFELKLDVLFERGLAALLDGFTPLVEKRKR